MTDNPAPDKAYSSRAWGWIPSVYMAEGLPYAIVNVLTAILYTNMGISKAAMAFYTGLIGFPWIFKPLWSPFIDLLKTKRWWTLLMQGLMSIGLLLVALFLPSSNFFVISLILFWIIAFCSATHDVAADGYYMMALNDEQQAAFVGVRSTCYRIAALIGQGGLLIFAGFFERKYNDVAISWSITFYLVFVFFLFILVWNIFMMPRPDRDKPIPGVTPKTILSDFANTFVSFFSRKHIWIAISFMLLFRLPEAFCLKIVPPFLLDSLEKGGLGLTTADVGTANGIIGVIGLLSGGIVGGVAVAKGGLKRWIWPMALTLTLPCAVYILFALYQPNFIWICIGIGMEQFGYGFGYTAMMMYLIYFCAGENQTSHFAFCTAFSLIGIIVPGMFAGWIFDLCEKFGNIVIMSTAGYIIFFSFIMISCVATFFAVRLVRPTLK